MSDVDGTEIFDTEMVQLNIVGGDLPPGAMIRESPTANSRGGTAIRAQANGQYHIDSFFDVFTELSVDGGQTWTAADAPARVTLVQIL